MPNSHSFYRDISPVLFYGILALLCFAFTGWMVYLLFVPAVEPAILKELDAWSKAHPKDSEGIGVMVLVGGFAWIMSSYHSETHSKLNALEKQLGSIADDLTELKSDVRDLDRKI